eukprot:6778650-Ditylum_brightwellii.AAC.1
MPWRQRKKIDQHGIKQVHGKNVMCPNGQRKHWKHLFFQQNIPSPKDHLMQVPKQQLPRWIN